MLSHWFHPLTLPIQFFAMDDLDLNFDQVLIGGFGPSTLKGEAGNDLLISLWGDNQFFGGEGDDWLIGGFGNDFLDGGPGNNRLFGGFGQDTFVLKNDGRVDTIADFAVGVDRFLLQGGLTYAQLAITQRESDTEIRYLGQTTPSVILRNVKATHLFEQDFRPQALVPTFTSLTIFGDSLSDPGNLFALTEGFPFSPPYSAGRFSNGDIWADYLVEQVGLEATQVQNFAFGGATTGRDNGLDPLISFLTGTEANLPGLLDEIDLYFDSLGAGGLADPEGLYVLWAGANDLFNLPSDPSDTEAIGQFLANSVQNIATAITQLTARGAQAFVIPNLPNLGLLPRNLDPSLSGPATALSLAFNTGLAAALEGLEQNFPTPIDIIPIDIFALTTEVISTPTEFGFTNVTDPLLEAGLLQDPGFFWWDDQHPTTRVHDLLADVFQAKLFEAGYLVAAVDLPVLAREWGAGSLGAIASPSIAPQNFDNPPLIAQGLETEVLPFTQAL
jgi:phospholipase/lecithinase/hemolysin